MINRTNMNEHIRIEEQKIQETIFNENLDCVSLKDLGGLKQYVFNRNGNRLPLMMLWQENDEMQFTCDDVGHLASGCLKMKNGESIKMLSDIHFLDFVERLISIRYNGNTFLAEEGESGLAHTLYADYTKNLSMHKWSEPEFTNNQLEFIRTVLIFWIALKQTDNH